MELRKEFGRRLDGQRWSRLARTQRRHFAEVNAGHAEYPRDAPHGVFAGIQRSGRNAEGAPQVLNGPATARGGARGPGRTPGGSNAGGQRGRQTSVRGLSEGLRQASQMRARSMFSADPGRCRRGSVPADLAGAREWCELHDGGTQGLEGWQCAGAESARRGAGWSSPPTLERVMQHWGAVRRRERWVNAVVRPCGFDEGRRATSQRRGERATREWIVRRHTLMARPLLHDGHHQRHRQDVPSSSPRPVRRRRS